MKRLNFIDPYIVAQVIYKPAPAAEEEVDAQTGLQTYGMLDLPRDAAIYDMGQGTGILGKLLTEQGYTNIQGGDASQKFVNIANASGWYQNCQVTLFG